MAGGIYFCEATLIQENIMPVTVGEEAPDFELENQDKKKVKLSDFRGKKKVVLMFYPLDWSPVCSNEHKCMKEDFSKFQGKDAEVLGISVDSGWCHKAFKEARGIPYDLLSDMKREVVQKYDLYLAEANIGRRATVVVGRDGKVAWFKEQAMKEERKDAEILEALEKAS
jgi:peroxiredoxin